MAKDLSYHQSAVVYNEQFMEFAAEMADKVEHPEVKKWCRGISKQHEFHMGRHKRALEKMESPEEENQPTDDDQTETPSPVDPAPAAVPVESNPDPEKAADPVENNPDPEQDVLFASERNELDFRSTGEVVGNQKQEQIA